MKLETFQARIAEKLQVPAANVRALQVSGTVLPFADLASAQQVQLASLADELARAELLPDITDGEPTKLYVSAWMCHAGTVNGNNSMFVAEELQEAAKKLKLPNLLPMDWNHSAVLQFEWDDTPTAIGVWYNGDYAFDQNADEGRGAYGIFVQGIVWAWMHKDYAEKMLAAQQVNGKVDFSMACIAGSIEMGQKDGKYFEILHNPVFFTNSALDRKPADKDAVGTVSTQRTTTASSVEEFDMNELEKAKQELAAANAQLAALEAAKAEALAGKETAEAKSAELSAKVATLEADLTTANTKLDTVTTQYEALVARTAEVDEQFKAATEKLAGFEKAAAEAEVKARFEKRIAELPENYLVAHAKRSDDEREKVEARWRSATDDEWAAIKADLAPLDKLRTSFLELSSGAFNIASQGSGVNTSDIAEILRNAK